MSETYSEVEIRIRKALDAFHTDQNVTIASLAREFDVPHQRLRARCRERQSHLDKVGGNRRLSVEQEGAICQYLDRLDSIGTAVRHHMVADCANHILSQQHNDPTSTPPTVGPRWTERFLQRHPEYNLCRQKTLDVNRKVAHDVESIGAWFVKFQTTMETYGISATDCYNMDETGFRIGVGRDQWILTKDHKRQSYLPSSSNRESVTVIETISDDGTVLPPMIILPGVLHQQIWYSQTDIDDDYLLGVSETGFSNNHLSFDWLKHFDKYTAARQAGVHRLLLLDGYGSHCTYEFITYCDERKIIPFCMPPHATHLLQPLDVVLFQPYKHWHAEAVDAATRTGCYELNKVEFLAALGSIRTRTFKRSSIVSGFRRTGLIPFDPHQVLSKMRENEPSRSPSPTTPSPPPEGPRPFTTPATIRTLQRQANILREMNLPSPTRRNLHTFLKGTITMVTAGQLCANQLEKTQAAEHARKLRQRQNRKTMQRGGVIYAREARYMVKERKIKELAAAKARLARVEKAVRKKRLAQVRKVVHMRFKVLRDRGKFVKDLDEKMQLVCAELLNRVDEVDDLDCLTEPLV